MTDYDLIFEVKNYFNVLNSKYIETQVKCPYHSDTKPSASINTKKKVFYCFAGCGGKTFQQIYDECIKQDEGTNTVQTTGRADNFNLDNSINSNNQTTIPVQSNFSKVIGPFILEEANRPSFNDTPVQSNFLLELQKVISAEQGSAVQIVKEISREECILHLKNLCKAKGISPKLLQDIKAEPIIDTKDYLYGYVKIPIGNNGQFVARKFLPDDIIKGEKYLNSTGEKPFYGEIKDEETDYIMVEGIFDYLSLKENGFNNVICNLGVALNTKRAYPFKDKIVFILFDNDFAGYEGTEKAYTVLRKIRANPIILELPKRFGKDINEAFINFKDETLEWLNSNVKVYDSDDTNYIQDFDKQESLFTLKTGIKIWDEILNGGLRVGIHAIAAEPGVGKTALSLFTVHNLVLLNKDVNVLYCTYEVPKSQCWARISSIYDSEHSWSELETNPTLLSPSAKSIATKLANKIRIVAMWNINEIVRAARNYQVIVIDYIQRMPGDTSDERTNTARNTKELSKLMMEQDKIIILISSIPRVAYGREDLSVFKECGDIEFCIQSGFLMKDINKGGEDRMLNIITLKNTRGPVGINFWLEGNMLHNHFKEIDPDTSFIKQDKEGW